jgi:hypothetical protein
LGWGNPATNSCHLHSQSHKQLDIVDKDPGKDSLLVSEARTEV